MDVYWLIGLNGWLALSAYSPQVVLSSGSGRTIDDVVQVDGELEEFERAYRERRAAGRSLAAADDVSQVAWPPDLPRPSADRNAIPGRQYQAAFDLTLLAVAALLLHEFRHVMLAVDGEQHASMRDEEMACDVWAREFMTVKAGLYAEQHDHAYVEVMRKRSMAFALASVMIHDTTPVWERCGSEAYYPVRDRVKALVSATALPKDDPFWVFAACLMLGIRREARMHVDVGALDSRALVEALVEDL